MAKSGSSAVSSELPGNQYVRLDFQSWNVTYALRSHAPEKNRHARELSAADSKEEVFCSTRLQRIVREVSKDGKGSEKEVEKEVREMLDEMGHSMFLPAVRCLALLLRPFICSALRGIFVSREGLQQLRGVVSQWPVVLLPSHRSYLDFLLISYIMFEHNIKLPYIAAGQDFMKMKLVSGLLRQSGAFFMRRTFGADRLYKAAFSEYVKTVLCSNDAPLEFFIEGTRSRTAKTLHPKLGLLSMVVEPYLAGLVPDIMLVPVSISYQRTLEEHLFSRELLGVPKPSESTRGLMKALSMIREDYGSIFVEFCQPVSLHDFCTSRGVSRVPHTVFPKDKSLILPQERQVILELSHVILDHTHHGMHVYPTAMTAALLLQHGSGLERGEPRTIFSSHPLFLRVSASVYRGADAEIREVKGTGGIERIQDALGGRRRAESRLCSEDIIQFTGRF
ncbi:Dihydroxyacetone phosphate acyltransferase [Geodia barretti]|uniref:Dihydroxyacetone phosphate acyltransferase n=1 Tax=Geodia barretti TaxID=519541 RepID=A0AA35RJY5_GEOBA|nr:Dihydroxyacetone phosphate acyltransferase [Geodia barretti]